MVGVFGLQVRQVPDAVIQAFGIEVDQADLLRRIELRQRSYSKPHEKTEILVFLPAKIGVKEFRMRGVVDGSQKVGVYVVHGFALQQRLREAQNRIMALAHPLSPVAEDSQRVGRRFGLSTESGKES